jgi:hypothetical protein
MTNEKILEILKMYEKTIETELVVCLSTYPNFEEKIRHLKDMIPKMRDFVAKGEREKCFRWLGFMQGTFDTLGIYNLEELKEHNRQTRAEYKAAHPEHAFLEGCPCETCKVYFTLPEPSDLSVTKVVGE